MAVKKKTTRKKSTGKKRARSRTPEKKRTAKKRPVKKRVAKKKATRKRSAAASRYIIAAGGGSVTYYNGKIMQSSRANAVQFGLQSVAIETARKIARSIKSIKQIGVFNSTDSPNAIAAAFDGKKKSRK